MSRLLALVAAVVAAVTFAPAAAAAPVSHAKLFVTKGLAVTCGVAIRDPGVSGTHVLCSARGVPAPRGGGIGSSGFVALGPTRSPKLLAIGQNSFVSRHPVKLGKGRRWSSLGVSCQVSRRTVLCFNRDNHGFVIGNGRYRSF